MHVEEIKNTWTQTQGLWLEPSALSPLSHGLTHKASSSSSSASLQPPSGRAVNEISLYVSDLLILAPVISALTNTGVFQHLLPSLSSPLPVHLASSVFTVLGAVLDRDITPLLHTLTSTPPHTPPQVNVFPCAFRTTFQYTTCIYIYTFMLGIHLLVTLLSRFAPSLHVQCIIYSNHVQSSSVFFSRDG